VGSARVNVPSANGFRDIYIHSYTSVRFVVVIVFVVLVIRLVVDRIQSRATRRHGLHRNTAIIHDRLRLRSDTQVNIITFTIYLLLAAPDKYRNCGRRVLFAESLNEFGTSCNCFVRYF